MSMIADILLGAGALGAALYCLVLSRRLQQLTRLESGMGGAIAVLSAQVDDMTRTLTEAQRAARHSSGSLEAQTERAEKAVRRLEILLASMHDLPDPAAEPGGASSSAAAVGQPVGERPERKPRVLRRRARMPEPQEGVQ